MATSPEVTPVHRVCYKASKEVQAYEDTMAMVTKVYFY